VLGDRAVRVSLQTHGEESVMVVLVLKRHRDVDGYYVQCQVMVEWNHIKQGDSVFEEASVGASFGCSFVLELIWM
jgi:hypothetical protein